MEKLPLGQRYIARLGSVAMGGGGIVSEHTWFDCELCGRSVRCGKCGNNCCNGGYGVLPNGEQCDVCPSAYDVQDAGEKP